VPSRPPDNKGIAQNLAGESSPRVGSQIIYLACIWRRKGKPWNLEGLFKRLFRCGIPHSYPFSIMVRRGLGAGH
jgi:hypothetical protein